MGTKLSRTSHRAKENDHGAAFVEFVISIPLIVLFLMFTFEVGRAFNQYLILSQIAYEGARIGAQLEGMQPACFGKSEVIDLGWKEETVGIPSKLVPHHLAQKRARMLLANYQESKQISVTGPSDNRIVEAAGQPYLKSQYIRHPAGGSSDPFDPEADYLFEPAGTYTECAAGTVVGSTRHTFGIRIEGEYQPKFFPVIKIPIAAHSQGAFLSNNTNFFVKGGPGVVNITPPDPPTFGGDEDPVLIDPDLPSGSNG